MCLEEMLKPAIAAEYFARKSRGSLAAEMAKDLVVKRWINIQLACGVFTDSEFC